MHGADGKHPGCDSSYIGRREISFTLENDIYVRYLSFHDAAEMEATIREKCPHKIDIGAVYNVDVRIHYTCINSWCSSLAYSTANLPGLGHDVSSFFVCSCRK